MYVPNPTSPDVSDLEFRVSELEKRLARKTEALQEASDEFQSLIYTITHDFRSPLRAILASCMILNEDYGDKLDDEGKEELDRQANNVRKMNGFLEELLRVSRLAKSEVCPQNVALSVIAAQAADEVSPTAREALTVENASLVADPVLLQVALRELFDNSLKFARPDEPPQIKVRKEGDRVVVSDNGLGFEAARAQRIFLPFEKLHGNDYKGAGVGLTLVKRSVELQGGRVGFNSTPGEGATFWLALEDA
jgi:light-regulated signal transduction histidine kinase (bacteriophytochrome)